MVNISGPIII